MKNTKLSIIVLIIIILASLVYIGLTNTSTLVLSKRARQAVAFMQKTDAVKTFNLLKSLTPKEKDEVIIWMQKKPEKIAPFYYMYFADDIFKTNKDEAAFWFLVGRLRAVEDVQMCKDKTATAQVAIYTSIAPNTVTYLSKKGSGYLSETLKKAVKWDEEHPQRVSPIWSCFHGIEAFSHYPELLPASEYKKIQIKTRTDVLGNK